MYSSSSTYQRSSAQGFTLVELLVTITILGVLLAIAVPNFTQMLQDKAAASAAEAFASDLRLARTEAIKRGVPIRLCGANAAKNGCLTGAGANDWTANGWLVLDRNADNPIIIKVQDLPIGSGAITVGGTFTFNPTGIMVGVGGSAIISPGNNTSATRIICINTAGKYVIIKGSTTCPSQS